jgi:hypothetical protein
MFTSAINGSANQNLATFQAQQQQGVAQQFQSLAQQLQSGNLPEAQTSNAPSNPPSNIETGPAQWDHRLRIPMEPGSDNTSSQAVDPLSPLHSMPSSAVEAYSSLGQNLQQLSLAADSTATEVAAQTSAMSVTL